jgi:hypothetical protein
MLLSVHAGRNRQTNGSSADLGVHRIKTIGTIEEQRDHRQNEITTEQSVSTISKNSNKNCETQTMATTTCCQLCCEANSTLVVLSCSHSACRECLTKWISKQELLNKKTVPCPYCHVNMNDSEIFQILGRPLQQTSTDHFCSEEQNSTELDELTRDWLQANTRQCPRCHLHIEKLDGCDKMECVCGCRFCFKCATANATCRCTPSRHVFFDNIRNCPSNLTVEAVVVVNPDASTETVGSMIIRRRQLEDNRLMEIQQHEERDPGVLWLLQVIRRMRLEATRRMCLEDNHWKTLERNRIRKRDSIEVEAINRAPAYIVSIYNGSWLFESKDSIKYLQWLMEIRQHEERDPDEPHPDTESVSTGLWLFQARTRRDSIQMLDRITRMDPKWNDTA